MSLGRWFRSLFAPRMSPLGQRLVDLLAPERWDEWKRVGDFIIHEPTDLRILRYNLSCLFVNRERICGDNAFQGRESHLLWRMVKRLDGHLERVATDKAVALASAHLMTEEERVIEDLLR